MQIDIVIPCFMENANCQFIYESIKNETNDLRYLSRGEFIDIGILFIDNYSTDNTRVILEDICLKDSRVKAIFNSKNYGQLTSPLHGLCSSKADAAILIACDGEDPVNLIGQMIDSWMDGNKIVACQKANFGESKLRSFFRRSGYRIMDAISRYRTIHDFHGFGLYDKSAIELFRTYKSARPYIRMLINYFNLDFLILRYNREVRLHGKSSNNILSICQLAIDGITQQSNFPIRLATLLGAISVMLCMPLSLVIISFIIAIADTSMRLLLLSLLIQVLGFSITLFIISSIGEYLLRMIDDFKDDSVVIEDRRINW
ncbi:glycosyltransferase [bacterium]|nr:glycosyltransferase [bacterium]